MNTKKIIEKYQMLPHPEGGYYREFWHSEEKIGNHSLMSHIYYLLKKDNISKWHRLQSDELWLHHQGGPLTLMVGGKKEKPETNHEVLLGVDCFHYLIPKGTWQSAIAKEDDLLVSCVVSPGFQEEDWELYEKSKEKEIRL